MAREENALRLVGWNSGRRAPGESARRDALRLIVGNADAHGKNFSLLYQADEIGLAKPFVRRRAVQLAEAVVAQRDLIREHPTLAELNPDALASYSSLIVSRAEDVARTGMSSLA